jgi:hypothetical protein
MRLLWLIGAVVLLAVAAPPAMAQAVLRPPSPDDLAGLKTPILLVADAATLRRELDRAIRQERRCMRTRWRRNCGMLRARIGKLQQQLRGSQRAAGQARSREGGFAGYSRGAYRTICVRVCDGYYYSLSHIASRQRLAQDAEKCKGQYPPGEAVLFFHRFPSDDVSRAQSLDGERYGDQQYAFVFRKSFMPQCAAQLHQGLAALRARVFAAVPSLLGEPPEEAEPGPEAELVPIPVARQERSGDPETLANRSGDIVPHPMSRHLAGMALRTVGDPYYFAEGTPGPPPTVPGYEPPELTDFRVSQRASLDQGTEQSDRERPPRSLSGG